MHFLSLGGAMKQHKKADGKSPKAGRRKATAPERPNAPKAARSNESPAAREEYGGRATQPRA